MHIYPAIDLLGGRCVRLRQGDYSQQTVFSDDPVGVARAWREQGARRLHLVDLDGAKAGQPCNGEVIRAIVQSVPLPCQLGGGIRTESDVAKAFDWGVRWVVLGTQALRDPAFVVRMAQRYPERIVLGLDAKGGYVATEGWLEVSSVSALELAKQVCSAPLAAVVYTDIARDGMMSGPNFEQLSQMQASVAVPVIASGGISRLEHIHRLLEMKTFGCIIGRALYEGAIRLPEVMGLPGVAECAVGEST